MICLRCLFARDVVTLKLKQYAVIFLVSISIGTLKSSLMILEIKFIGRHPFTMSGYMSGAVVIRRNSYQNSGIVLIIVVVILIYIYQRSFHWTQRMILIFLLDVLQYQMINLVLIILWGSHLQNQRETLMDHLNFPIKLSLFRLFLR